MTILIKSLFQMTLPITLIKAALLTTEFTFNWFLLKNAFAYNSKQVNTVESEVL
jgi:hypothetical protein